MNEQEIAEETAEKFIRLGAGNQGVLACMIAAAIRTALDEAQRWIPVDEALPSVELGCDEQYWVLVRHRDGRTYVCSLYYVNRPLLPDGASEDWELSEQADDVVGWYRVGPNREYSDWYERFEPDSGSEVIAWQEMNPPEAGK